MRMARAAFWLGMFAASIGAGFGIGATILGRAGAQDLTPWAITPAVVPSASSVPAACSPAATPAAVGARPKMPTSPGPWRPPQPPPPAPVQSHAVPPAPGVQPAVFSAPSGTPAVSSEPDGVEPSFTVFPGTLRLEGTSAQEPRFHVQAGTFSTRQDALALGLRLESLGYFVIVIDTLPYRVWVGDAVDQAAAERLADHLRKAGFTAVVAP